MVQYFIVPLMNRKLCQNWNTVNPQNKGSHLDLETVKNDKSNVNVVSLPGFSHNRMQKVRQK